MENKDKPNTNTEYSGYNTVSVETGTYSEIQVTRGKNSYSIRMPDYKTCDNDDELPLETVIQFNAHLVKCLESK